MAAQHGRTKGRLTKMRTATALPLLILLTGAALSISCRAESDPDFELRQYSEVYYNDGRKEVGVVTPTDDSSVFKIKAVRTQISHDFNMRDVKEKRDQRTADTAMDDFAKDWNKSKNATLLLKRMKYAWEHWNMQKKVVALLETAATSNDPDVLEYLAELYMQGNRARDAQRIGDALVAAAPQRARAYMWRGKALLEQGNLAAAEGDLKKAFEMAPTDEQVMLARSKYLVAAGHPDEANKMLTTVISKSPQNASAMVQRGIVLLNQGDFEAAEQAFVAAPLDNDEGQIGLAATKLMRKQYDDAYRIAEGVLSKHPKSAEAYEIEAFAKLLSGDKESLDKFEEKITNAFKERADQPRLLLAYAVGLEREAKYIELVGGKTAPDDAKAKRDQAAAKYKELFAKDTSDAYLKYFVGEWFFRKGDYAAAEDAFNKVATLSPSYAPGLAAAGATALRLRKWEAAQKFYEAAGGLDPSSGEYQAGQGLALLGQKDLGKAKEKLGRALTLEPKNVSALSGLGYISNNARDKDSAVAFFEQALAVDGRCSYAADALKKIYAQSNLDLEYQTFDESLAPPGWQGKGRGMIKPVLQDGHIVFAGTQGSSQGDVVDFTKEVRTDAFVRLEADINVPVGMPVTAGVRISGVGGSKFFLEWARVDDEMKIRFLDNTGGTVDFASTSIKWPDDGHARLAIETSDMKAGGKCNCDLSINGKKVRGVPLMLNRTNSVSAGVFVIASPNTTISASADNIALLSRHSSSTTEGTGAEAIKILNPEDKKPDPAPAPAPAPTPAPSPAPNKDGK